MRKCEKCGAEIDNKREGNTVVCSSCAKKANEIALASLGGVVLEKIEPDMSPMNFETRYSTKILLIRHGESLGNAKHVFLGHTDLDLSERGYAQAERTAEFLKDEKVDVIYSSSLIRAYNTAVPHARIRNMQIIKSDNLREINAGEWENHSVEDLIEEYGETFTVEWRQRFGSFSHLVYGESVPALALRIYSEIERIARENVGKTILIATHAAAIRSFWGKLCGLTEKEVSENCQFPYNASVSVVYYDGEKLIPGEYSHQAHLSDV